MDKVFVLPPSIIVGTIVIMYLFQVPGHDELSQSLDYSKIEPIVSKDNLAMLNVSESIDSHAVLHLSALLYNTGDDEIRNIRFSMDDMGLLGKPYDDLLISERLDPGKAVSYDQIVMPANGNPDIGTMVPVTIEGMLQNGTNVVLSSSTVVDKMD